MARRAKKTTKVRLSAIRDVINSCADSLCKALQKQIPDIDPDDVEEGLRNLVKSLGGTIPGSNDAATVASIKPEYNLSGDLFILASEHYKKGDFRTAFKLFASAVDANDSTVLVAGIREMNASSNMAEMAEAMSEDEDEDTDVENTEDSFDEDTSDEEDAMDEVACELEDEDPEMADDDEESDEDAFGSDDVMDEELAEVDDGLDDEDDGEEEETPPAEVTISKSIRALANKASLDGSDIARNKAKSLLKKTR